jgi:ABC-type amino acid transport substrate-binding protein
MGAARPVTAGMRTLRGLSGTLAGGLVALAIAVCAAQWLAGTAGRPGPGMAAVVGHAAAALATVALQLMADRFRGTFAALASGSVLVIVAGVLWFGWWA